MAESAKFGDVEFASPPPASASFYIDQVPLLSLVAPLAFLFSFVVIHTAAAFRAAPILATREEFFALNSTDRLCGSMDVDMSVSQLQTGHRFVSINGSMISSSARSLPINVTRRRTFFRNKKPLGLWKTDSQIHELRWMPGKNSSSDFEALHFWVSHADACDLHMRISGNYSAIDGFRFLWRHGDPGFQAYRNSAQLLLAVLACYMFATFAWTIRFDTEAFTQLFRLIVGASGILAANPLRSFVTLDGPRFRIAGNVFLGIFIALLRMFMVLELEMLRSHSSTPPKALVAVLAVFFGLYAVADIAATYDRQCHVFQSQTIVLVVFHSEVVVMRLDAFYLVASAVYWIVAWTQHGPANRQRVTFFGIVLVISGIATFVTQIVFVLINLCLYSVVPMMVMLSAHVVVAASMCLSLMQVVGGKEYTEFEPMKGQEPTQVLDVDQLSDSEEQRDEDRPSDDS
jgi:hypothetical protein